MEKPNLCECGKKPKVRYNQPFSWVECPRCHTCSEAIGDWYEQGDGKSETIRLWNLNMRFKEE